MSYIFNEYAKIAVDQGLIKEAQVTEKPNPRYDSLDLDAIEMLYGVKPDGNQPHIVEQAHPEPVIVSPAYDRVNGLVENQLERQDIMHYIATKPNHGKHIMERYVKAHQDLVNEIVRVGFLLDKEGEEELMNFADECAERLVKKTAIAPAVILGLKAGAVLLTSLGLINNFGGLMSAGLMADAERAIDEVQDLIDDNEMPGETETLQNLISDINDFKAIFEEANSFTVDPKQSPETVKSEVQEGKKLLIEFIKKAKTLVNNISIVTKLIEASHGQDDTWLSRRDWGVAIEKFVGSFWTSDKKDALTILETFRDSVTESIAAMQKYFSAVKAKAEKFEAEVTEEDLEEGKAEVPPEIEELLK